jgi:fructoselysine-6-P-deglycase FrlB-like protein
MDLYYPPDSTSGARTPAVVFVTSETSREIIRRMLAFLRFNLAATTSE